MDSEITSPAKEVQVKGSTSGVTTIFRVLLQICKNENLGLVDELFASAIISAVIWLIGVSGLQLVAYEAGLVHDVPHLYLLLAAPIFLGVMSFALVKWSGGYKGPPDLIKLLLNKAPEFPGWLRAIITWLIACIELGFGISPKGFEGPYVAAGGGFSGQMAQKFGFSPEACQRLARVGLGIAFGVLFRTPLGGFVAMFEFGHGLSKEQFQWRLIPDAITATIVSWWLTSATHFPAPFATLAVHNMVTSTMLLLFVAIGIANAIAAIMYVYAIRFAKRISTWLQKKLPMLVIPIIGASVSTLLGALFPIILGSNDLSRALTQASTLSVWVLLGAVVAKIIATAAADGAFLAGGTVGPAIIEGGMVGILVQKILSGGQNPLFAAIGCACFIGPVAGLNFTMFVTVMTWMGFVPVSWSLLLPLAIAWGISHRVQLYPVKK